MIGGKGEDFMDEIDRSMTIFYILETYGEMHGERIAALNHAMEECIEGLATLAKYNGAKLKIAVMEFNSGCRWMTVNGPEKIEKFHWQHLEAGGLVDLGAALYELDNKLYKYMSYNENDFMPIFIFMSTECPTDDYDASLKRINDNVWYKFGRKIGFCLGDDYVLEILSRITGNSESVIRTTDLDLFRRLMVFIPMKDVFEEKQLFQTFVRQKDIAEHKEGFGCNRKMDKKENFIAGDRVSTICNGEYTICKVISESGKSNLYIVEDKNGNRKILNWMEKTALWNLQFQYMNIKNKVLRGSPCKEFLWPLDVTYYNDESFGYIVDIIEDKYYELTEFMLGKVRFNSYKKLIDVALSLVNAFRILYSQGYNYVDLNSGNIMIDPVDGKVMICDTDNICIMGEQIPIMEKPRYMAPEEVRAERGKIIDDSKNFRYSIAVILFELFCLNHPLEGKRYLTSVLTPEVQQKLYGKEALFIFEPLDDSNGPHPTVHGNTITRWNSLPAYIQEMFFRVFSQNGLRNYSQRPRKIEWLNALTRFRSEIIRCSCGCEFFYNKTDICPDCGKKIAFDYRMKLKNYILPIKPDTRIYKCQLGICNLYEALEPIAQVLKKKESNVLGLRNKTVMNWKVKDSEGHLRVLKPNEIIIIDRNFVFSVDGCEWIKIEKVDLENDNMMRCQQ